MMRGIERDTGEVPVALLIRVGFSEKPMATLNGIDVIEPRPSDCDLFTQGRYYLVYPTR